MGARIYKDVGINLKISIRPSVKCRPKTVLAPQPQLTYATLQTLVQHPVFTRLKRLLVLKKDTTNRIIAGLILAQRRRPRPNIISLIQYIVFAKKSRCIYYCAVSTCQYELHEPPQVIYICPCTGGWICEFFDHLLVIDFYA